MALPSDRTRLRTWHTLDVALRSRKSRTRHPIKHATGVHMASWKIAHLHQQGQDMIIVPLESAFGNKPGGMQSEFIEALQICAADAGLAGIVVPVWKAG